MKTESELPDYARRFVEKDRMGAFIGARFVSLTRQECIYEYEFNPQHANPNGILHGGVLYTVMDSSQGMLVHAILDSAYKVAATGTSTIRYLAPVREGVVRIVTTLKEQKERKIFMTSKAYDPSGTLVVDLEEVWIAIKN